MNGGAGDDTIYADTTLLHFHSYLHSADSVDGGDGDDHIYFGQYDTITGGDGNDTYHYAPPHDMISGRGPATITDFTVGDRIEVATGYHQYDTLSDFSFTLRGADVVISSAWGDGELIILEGAASVFSMSDFEIVRT